MGEVSGISLTLVLCFKGANGRWREPAFTKGLFCEAVIGGFPVACSPVWTSLEQLDYSSSSLMQVPARRDEPGRENESVATPSEAAHAPRGDAKWQVVATEVHDAERGTHL